MNFKGGFKGGGGDAPHPETAPELHLYYKTIAYIFTSEEKIRSYSGSDLNSIKQNIFFLNIFLSSIYYLFFFGYIYELINHVYCVLSLKDRGGAV